jgi:hypothetical protein
MGFPWASVIFRVHAFSPFSGGAGIASTKLAFIAPFVAVALRPTAYAIALGSPAQTEVFVVMGPAPFPVGEELHAAMTSKRAGNR